MLKRRLLVSLALFAAFDQNVAFGDAGAPQFRKALAPRSWSFPRDHGRHDGYKIEWWYFTGNLADAAGNQFGYQLTIFRSSFSPVAMKRPSPWGTNDVYFAHAAVTDVAGNTFVFGDRLSRGMAGLAGASSEKLDVFLRDWSIRMNPDGAIHLRAVDPKLSIDLTCAPGGRGPFLEGPGGVNAKSREPGRASYYYSMTRLKTSGTVSANGQVATVSGLSWMDHEFSSDSLGSTQIGWDWMGLQLDNGQDLMIYRLRGKTLADDYLSGTRVDADGRPAYLTAKDLSLSGSNPWTSSQSHAEYPQTWSVRATGLPPMTVKTDVLDQELRTSDSTNVTYYEGAATVTDAVGKAIGRGYLEMTGYAGSINGSR